MLCSHRNYFFLEFYILLSFVIAIQNVHILKKKKVLDLGNVNKVAKKLNLKLFTKQKVEVAELELLEIGHVYAEKIALAIRKLCKELLHLLETYLLKNSKGMKDILMYNKIQASYYIKAAETYSPDDEMRLDYLKKAEMLRGSLTNHPNDADDDAKSKVVFHDSPDGGG